MGVMRGFVVLVYVAAFLVALWQISRIWPLVNSLGEQALYFQLAVVFSLMVALCGVLISIFVYIDGVEIDELREFTGLRKHMEEEELRELPEEETETTIEDYTKRESKTGAKEEECGTCVFFSKTALCPLREKNPKATSCKNYKEK